MNPASLLPLAAGSEFTQPRDHSFVQPCIRYKYYTAKKWGIRPSLFLINLSESGNPLNEYDNAESESKFGVGLKFELVSTLDPSNFQLLGSVQLLALGEVRVNSLSVLVTRLVQGKGLEA